MTKIPIAQQLAEVRREMSLRASVYPRQVAQGKMTRAQADHCMAAMAAVLKTLEWCAANAPTIRADLAELAEFRKVTR
jgi:hypothetical protein